MTSNRIAAGVLSIVLLALLGWLIFAGLGDVRTRVILAVGTCLGNIYAFFGGLPDWIIAHSDGTITADDDPANLSPRIYLPILLGVLAIAVIAFVVVLKFL